MGRRLAEAAAALLLLSALAWQLSLASASDGLTNDELLYIPAGHRQLTAGDYRLSPVHPPLALSFNALGLLGRGLQVPPLGAGDDVLAWCFRFIHVENDANVVIRGARRPVIALSLALAALVWLWARAVAGPRAGLAALFAVAFHPSIVAHGHLATTDLGGAFAALVAAWCFWRWLQKPGPARAALLVVAGAAGAATRHTTLVLLPVFATATAWELLVRRRRPAVSPGLVASGVGARALLPLVACALVLVPPTIWAAYGFHDAPWPDGLMRRPRVSARIERWLSLGEASRVVPAGFVGSLRFQLEHARHGHPGYLLGERRMRGWWHYPLVAFGVKNTPGFLAAVLLLPWVLLRRRGSGRGAGHGTPPSAASGVPAWGLWLGCALAVFASASLARIQIGERYLLPLYPFACLLIGALAPAASRIRLGALVLVASAALHAGPTLGAVLGGGAIPYFNPLAGGREGGHRLLLDSNLDWGQDLPRLAAWMRKEGVGLVQLAYHGADDPARYGIAWEDLPSVHAHPTRPAARPFHGVVVVSPNHLLGLPPAIGDTYAVLRARAPDARAGVFFVYRLP